MNFPPQSPSVSPVLDKTQEEWTTVITPDQNPLHIPWKELWDYRELVIRFVHRDFVSRYKQTVLGSFWYVIQPLITSLMFTVIFNKVAKISTGEIPPMLFFLAGTVCWGYFSSCVTQTASTFGANGSLFDKVYFPRLAVPISQLIVNLIGFGMQMAMFLGFFLYYYLQGAGIEMGWRVIVFPVLIIQMAALGLGVGCIVTAVTTRFRDLQVMLGFFMQLWMYASCVVYPLDIVPLEYRWIFDFNPMVFIIEAFRYSFLGQGTVYLWQIGMSMLVSILAVLVGLVLFNKTQKNCVDVL